MGASSGIYDEMFDAVIVGGGPAGASCAVWLARLGFAPALIEAADEPGGLCRSHSYLDEWNASLPGMTGIQVADNLARSLRQAGVPLWLSCRVERIDADARGFTLRAAGMEQPLRGRCVVLASGVLPRARAQFGGLPGVLVGPGRHVSDHDFSGEKVAVLGGGDNGFENALYALEHGARSVDLYARTVRAQRQFVQRLPPSLVHVGDYSVDAARRAVNGVEYDLLMVFYGWEPCADYAESLGLRRNAQGFIATDAQTAQTSHPGVYAIGEVAQRQHPCVVTALADGVTAAKAIQARLEAA
ncbi:MAG: NAD(P)/FAD-dependent oxidoreductase [Alcaligenaceae bacterium]|nr:NAD(P)/FAD-dependent oxidoreductase [Alcaligenaceae bacterium]